jgi:hypothetical protein
MYKAVSSFTTTICRHITHKRTYKQGEEMGELDLSL